MYASLLHALRDIGAESTEVDTHYGNDFAERTAPPDGVLISYHSVGNAPNVWRLKETPIPFFYSLDRLGYSGWSELSVEKEKFEPLISAESESEAKTFCNSISDWLVRENLSKYMQSSESISGGADFVLFPLQVSSDIVATHNRMNPLDVLHEAAKICKRQRRMLVVKRHPYCTSKTVVRRLVLERILNKYVRITNASITSLLSACNAVLVGNSGVGLEAIVYGKPVYSFARSEYEIATHQVCNLDDISSAFTSPPMPHPNGYKFGHYYLRKRCFDARDPSDVRDKLRNFIGLK